MTYDFLKQLISVSLMSTVAIITVIILKKLLMSKLSPKAHLFVWLPVVLRLIVPNNLTSRISVYNHIPDEVYEAVYVTFNPVNTASAMETSKLGPVFAIWLAGALLCVVFPFVSYMYFLHSVRKSSENKVNLDSVAADALKISGLKKMPGLIVCRGDMSPMVTGFIKPRLLIPEWAIEKLSYEQLRIIFVHEYTHLKRCDRFINMMLIFICAMYWFNPAVWIMSSYIRRDIENVCDEEVLKSIGAKNPGIYGETLLELAEGSGNSMCTRLVSPMASRHSSLRTRMKILLGYGKKRVGASILPLTVVISVTLLTGAMADEAEKTANIISEEIISPADKTDIFAVEPQSISDDVSSNHEPENETEAEDMSHTGSAEEIEKSAQEIQAGVSTDTEKYVEDSKSDSPKPGSDTENNMNNSHSVHINTPSASPSSKPDSGTITPPEETPAQSKVYTYSSSDAVARFSTDKKSSGFACNTGDIRIDTVGLISSDENSLHGYFNVYKDGELVGESVRAYVSSTPSSITFSQAEGDLDYSFNVKTKTIS